MVLVDWVTFLSLVILLIMLFVVAMNHLRHNSLPTTEHISLIFQFRDFLTAVFLFCLVLANGISVVTTQKNVQKYIIALFNYVYEHNLLKKARECQHKAFFSPEMAESIDEILTAGMLAAEKQCQVSYHLSWENETNAVMTAYNIVQTHLSLAICK